MRDLPGRGERTKKHKAKQRQKMMSDTLRGGYGNDMYDYGNHTKGGIHVTHWKDRKSYGGSNQGGGSIGGGASG